MSFRNIDETRERERLEKLFRSSGETRELRGNHQIIKNEPSSRLQPYLIGAALSMFLIGFACVLQEPQREATSEKPFQSVQTPPISDQLHTAPAAQFFIAASKAGLTGIVDSRTLTASYYWTVVLKNSSNSTQEAFATLKLPEGAVVSRATEWINGIPQEAAFNTVASTNNAYNNLTSRGRDPLIVNAIGDNSVEIKAFPINPDGGIVKIRLGITAPMKVNAEGKASVAAPYLVSSNFDANSSVEFHIQSRSHLLAVTSAENGAATRNVASKELSGISKDNEKYVLSTHVNQDELKNLTIETNSNASESEFAVRATHSPKTIS